MARKFRIQFADDPFRPGVKLKRLQEDIPFRGEFMGIFTTVKQGDTVVRGRRRYALPSRKSRVASQIRLDRVFGKNRGRR